MGNTEVIQRSIDLLQEIINTYEKILNNDLINLDENLEEKMKDHLINLQSFEKDFRSRFERLTEGESSRLEIGVIGTFNDGKSTFINSLLGEELLKMDIKPSTAKISRIQYGDSFEILKKLKNGRIENVSRDEFASTSNHDEANNLVEDHIDHFVINYPSPVLKKFVFIDTPGFSSSSAKDDEVTKEWIPKFDLVIWLVSCLKGELDEEQARLVEEFKDKRRICVLNRSDLKILSDIDKIKANLDKYFDRVFPYSATKILAERKNQSVVNQQFENLIASARFCYEQKSEFTFQFDNSKLEFQSNSCNGVIPIVHYTLDNRYENYLRSFIHFLDEIRKDVFQIKMQELESSVMLKLRSEKDEIEYFAKTLSVIIRDKKSDISWEEKVHPRRKEKLEQALVNKYVHLRDELFEQIHELLFEEVELVKGGFLSDTKRGLVRKASYDDLATKDKVFELVSESFMGFVEYCFIELYKLFETDQESINILNTEVKTILVGTGKILASSVRNSIDVLVTLWQPDTVNTLDQQKEYLFCLIDKIVPYEDLVNHLSNALDQMADILLESKQEDFESITSHLNKHITSLRSVYMAIPNPT